MRESNPLGAFLHFGARACGVHRCFRSLKYTPQRPHPTGALNPKPHRGDTHRRSPHPTQSDGAARTRAAAARRMGQRNTRNNNDDNHTTHTSARTRHGASNGAHDGARFSVLFFSRLPFSLARLRLHLFLLQWFVSFVIPPLFVHSSPRGATTSS